MNKIFNQQLETLKLYLITMHMASQKEEKELLDSSKMQFVEPQAVANKENLTLCIQRKITE